jgi:hypothetical protein
VWINISQDSELFLFLYFGQFGFWIYFLIFFLRGFDCFIFLLFFFFIIFLYFLQILIFIIFLNFNLMDSSFVQLAFSLHQTTNWIQLSPLYWQLFCFPYSQSNFQNFKREFFNFLNLWSFFNAKRFFSFHQSRNSFFNYLKD